MGEHSSLVWLRDNPEFERTSEHPNWQGKVQCIHCGKTGWPGSRRSNFRWWGGKHGPHCVYRP